MALVVLETAARNEAPAPAGLELVQAKRYGDTRVLFFRKHRAVRAAAAAPDPPEKGMPP